FARWPFAADKGQERGTLCRRKSRPARATLLLAEAFRRSEAAESAGQNGSGKDGFHPVSRGGNIEKTRVCGAAAEADEECARRETNSASPPGLCLFRSPVTTRSEAEGAG